MTWHNEHTCKNLKIVTPVQQRKRYHFICTHPTKSAYSEQYHEAPNNKMQVHCILWNIFVRNVRQNF